MMHKAFFVAAAALVVSLTDTATALKLGTIPAFSQVSNQSIIPFPPSRCYSTVRHCVMIHAIFIDPDRFSDLFRWAMAQHTCQLTLHLCSAGTQERSTPSSKKVMLQLSQEQRFARLPGRLRLPEKQRPPKMLRLPKMLGLKLYGKLSSKGRLPKLLNLRLSGKHSRRRKGRQRLTRLLMRKRRSRLLPQHILILMILNRGDTTTPLALLPLRGWKALRR